MERTPRVKQNIPPINTIDFGVSSDPARRCKTCACHFEVTNPQAVGQKQSLCRRNGVILMAQAGGNVGLSYPPTQPELVCFDGWRPATAAPGANWKQEQLAKAVTPLLEKALKQAGVNSKLAQDLGRAMCDAAINETDQPENVGFAIDRDADAED